MSAFASRPPDGGGWRTFTDPLSAELQAFPRACAEAAERLAQKDNPESDGTCFSRAAEFCANIALDHLACRTGQANCSALGISGPMLMTIEPIRYVAPGDIENVAEQFCKRYSFLIGIIAEAIRNYEAGPGAKEVVLT
jgi:hypothetical protein